MYHETDSDFYSGKNKNFTNDRNYRSVINGKINEQKEKQKSINEILFKSGRKYFDLGIDIDNATLILCGLDGKEFYLKDNIFFQRGYQSGLIDMGRSLGSEGVKIEDLDKKYVGSVFFMNGYYYGIGRYYGKMGYTIDECDSILLNCGFIDNSYFIDGLKKGLSEYRKGKKGRK